MYSPILSVIQAGQLFLAPGFAVTDLVLPESLSESLKALQTDPWQAIRRNYFTEIRME